MQAGIDRQLGKYTFPQEFEKALYKIRFGWLCIPEPLVHNLALPMATRLLVLFNSYRCGKCS